MKVKVKNLGVLKQAEFELGDLTIICGQNNTGKTYATYALYGFLDFWKTGYTLEIQKDLLRELSEKGSAIINLERYEKNAQVQIQEALNNIHVHKFSQKFLLQMKSTSKKHNLIF